MPHEGYVEPIMNDGPRFHSNVPISELTEHITRAIEASDVSLAPPVVKTADGVMHETQPNPFRAQRSSGAKASHMWLNASQRSVLRHEAAVASFNMSNDRPGFEGQPMKGLRPPRIKQS